jgi:hypothetical protein
MGFPASPHPVPLPDRAAFARPVRGVLWHFATGDDEAAASRRLRRHLQGEFPQRRGMELAAAIRTGPEWSDDARLVRAVREVAARGGLRGDPFPLMKREKPQWTRERWDKAAAELDNRGGIER